MSNELSNDLKSKIFEIRGKQVMFSSDVAFLYNVETKVLNQTIKRNINRFPEEFCFQLSDIEFKNLRSQFVTSRINNNYGGIRYMPYVLTEQGIMMLSGLLKSNIAVEVNIRIINAFVEMRKYISSGLIELNYINKKLVEHDNRINLLEESFCEFDKKEDKEIIYFEKQYFRSYSKVINIFNKAKRSLIIIDNFVDNDTLDIISKLNNIKVYIITDKSTCYIKEIDIEKYNKEFGNLTVIYNKTFHDRFFILDKKDIYHCGASIKDLGNKTFAINRLVEDSVNSNLLNKIKSILLIK